MRFDVLTIFPSLFDSVFEKTVIGKAREKGIIEIVVHNIRDYATDKHRTTDDLPYGGGPGMVMKPEPIFRAVRDIKEKFGEGYVVLLTPSGRLFSADLAKELAGRGHLILICGRYEGVDGRVSEYLADMELSIGDYVLTGGEIPAMVVIDAVSRFVPGVVKNQESVENDSFEMGILESPPYTRPADFEGMKVPEVLLSGHHRMIDEYRLREGLKRTLRYRPDLLEKANLSPQARKILEELRKEGVKEGK
ncbi:MAG: tRNA (guanosine(37)-N1)-methyltransferase TrmD [Deltaproteobacteria bacterium]|nr:MAG: tRNA (guanosine(37)-N1)-methyltransferase TrmD [Deltaproteobacteria bacterium]